MLSRNFTKAWSRGRGRGGGREGGGGGGGEGTGVGVRGLRGGWGREGMEERVRDLC